MKNVLVLGALVYLLLITQANAQVGLQAGATATPDEAFTPYDGTDKVSGAVGYTFGVLYKYWLTDHVSLQPALNLVNKRWWEELDDGGTFYITRVSLDYLEFPVQVVFTTHKTRGFFVGAGPSVMIGLSGKRTVTEDGDLIEDDKIKIGSENAPENRLTIAGNVMAGYAFKNVLMGLNYSWGMTNQPVDDADHGNVSHLTLRIGLLLGKQ